MRPRHSGDSGPKLSRYKPDRLHNSCPNWYVSKGPLHADIATLVAAMTPAQTCDAQDLMPDFFTNRINSFRLWPNYTEFWHIAVRTSQLAAPVARRRREGGARCRALALPSRQISTPTSSAPSPLAVHGVRDFVTNSCASYSKVCCQETASALHRTRLPTPPSWPARPLPVVALRALGQVGGDPTTLLLPARLR